MNGSYNSNYLTVIFISSHLILLCNMIYLFIGVKYAVEVLNSLLKSLGRWRIGVEPEEISIHI